MKSVYLLPACSHLVGVPQLSLGEKAILTATPDFVSRHTHIGSHQTTDTCPYVL